MGKLLLLITNSNANPVPNPNPTQTWLWWAVAVRNKHEGLLFRPGLDLSNFNSGRLDFNKVGLDLHESGHPDGAELFAVG